MGTKTRPFTEVEVDALQAAAQNKRDQLLMAFLRYTGFRISEALSLRVRDVFDGVNVLPRVTVSKRFMKKKTAGRSVIMNEKLKPYIVAWVQELQRRDYLRQDTYLFRKMNGWNRSINRKKAHRIIKCVCDLAEVNKYCAALHSFRKYFGRTFYRMSGNDIVATAAALGHQNINSTAKYLEIGSGDVDRFILSAP